MSGLPERRSRLALAVVAATWVLSCGAVTSVVAAQAPPDVVELANGGMVRGTLVENLPGDHVTIQLATGEVRTFAAAEVRAVRPSTPEPSYAQGMAVPAPPEPMVSLTVVGTSEELSLHRLTGTASVSVWTGRGIGTAAIDQFAILCGAPCQQTVPAGSYTLGVSQGNGAARRADHSIFHFDHDVTLELDYESREGIRVAGWVIFGVASVGYALGATVPLFTGATDLVDILLVSTGVYLAICIPVIVMVALNDHADVREIAEGLADGVRF